MKAPCCAFCRLKTNICIALADSVIKMPFLSLLIYVYLKKFIIIYFVSANYIINTIYICIDDIAVDKDHHVFLTRFSNAKLWFLK